MGHRSLPLARVLNTILPLHPTGNADVDAAELESVTHYPVNDDADLQLEAPNTPFVVKIGYLPKFGEPGRSQADGGEDASPMLSRKEGSATTTNGTAKASATTRSGTTPSNTFEEPDE